MTVTVCLILITILSTITALVTEAVKDFLDSIHVKYVTNIVVLVVALLVGCGVTALYFVHFGIPFTVINTVYIFVMGIANWVGAMVGYDKVKQAIKQAGGKHNGD